MILMIETLYLESRRCVAINSNPVNYTVRWLWGTTQLENQWRPLIRGRGLTGWIGIEP